MANTGEILKGAYDIHLHAAPDVVERKQDGFDLARAAQGAGMAGLALKDHTTSTTGRAQALCRAFSQGPKFFGCLALNPPIGGLNSCAVESALREGAKIIYFPTYGAKNHINIWGAGKPPTAFPLPEPYEGISILAPDGNLRPECEPILALAARFDAVVATGHLSPQESLVLLRRAKDAGVKRLLATHVSESVTPFTPRQQSQAADLGAFIEHCFFAVTDHCPDAITLEDIRDQIRLVGVEKVILSSDFGQVSNPPPVEGFAIYLEKMLAMGFSRDELRVMICDNPGKLLC